MCSELTACLFYFHCAGWGFDCWLWAEGSCSWRHSWSAFQGGEGIRCVTSGLVQGEKGETTIIREMGLSYFEAFSCSMHFGLPFWSDFFVSYTQCYTCWEVLQSFDFSSVLVRPSDSFALWFDYYDHSRSFSISYCWSVSDYQFWLHRWTIWYVALNMCEIALINPKLTYKLQQKDRLDDDLLLRTA